MAGLLGSTTSRATPAYVTRKPDARRHQRRDPSRRRRRARTVFGRVSPRE